MLRSLGLGLVRVEVRVGVRVGVLGLNQIMNKIEGIGLTLEGL